MCNACCEKRKERFSSLSNSKNTSPTFQSSYHPRTCRSSVSRSNQILFQLRPAFCQENSHSIWFNYWNWLYKIGKMSCCGMFGTFCTTVVLVQLICGVFRWLYENAIGPKFFGKSIDFKKYGSWARKWKFSTPPSMICQKLHIWKILSLNFNTRLKSLSMKL